jgi:hypothetical protein
VTAPVPDPPLDVRVSPVPAVPLIEVSVRGVWDFRTAGANVTVVAGELVGKYVASPALVTVTVHVPALVAFSVAPVMTQPAVPVLVTP